MGQEERASSTAARKAALPAAPNLDLHSCGQPGRSASGQVRWLQSRQSCCRAAFNLLTAAGGQHPTSGKGRCRPPLGVAVGVGAGTAGSGVWSTGFCSSAPGATGSVVGSLSASRPQAAFRAALQGAGEKEAPVRRHGRPWAARAQLLAGRDQRWWRQCMPLQLLGGSGATDNDFQALAVHLQGRGPQGTASVSQHTGGRASGSNLHVGAQAPAAPPPLLRMLLLHLANDFIAGHWAGVLDPLLRCTAALEYRHIGGVALLLPAICCRTCRRHAGYS